MLKIRLSKTGKRNAPSFRIVVSEASSKRDGKHIDIIGHYNPAQKKDYFSYSKERYKEWIKNGAKPTNAVLQIISGKYKFKKYTPKEQISKKEESAK